MARAKSSKVTKKLTREEVMARVWDVVTSRSVEGLPDDLKEAIDDLHKDHIVEVVLRIPLNLARNCYTMLDEEGALPYPGEDELLQLLEPALKASLKQADPVERAAYHEREMERHTEAVAAAKARGEM